MRLESPESRRQYFYPTQGCNESFGQFTCRVGGLQIIFDEPVQLLRRESIESDTSSSCSITQSLDSVSARKEDHLLQDDGFAAGQRYYFTMRDSLSNNSRSRVDDHCSKPLLEHDGKQNYEQQATVTVKKSILQRMLRVIARCFIPCIKVKI